MINAWPVLLPPLIVLIVAFLTHKLNPSLFIGIICAALIAMDFSITETIKLMGSSFYLQLTDLDNLYMYFFLCILGTIIVLINKTGGAQAFAKVISKKLKTAKTAQASSLVLSLFVCIDDYLSVLTTGYVMRPITDSFKIPRVKLAFLIHALAGPLIVLAPISSWDAMIINQLDTAGVNAVVSKGVRVIADPFFIYIFSIPFIFYSIYIIASAWFIVLRNISYGPMAKYEKIAEQTGNLSGGKKEIDATHHDAMDEGSISDMLVPIAILLCAVFLGIPFTGGFHPFHGDVTLLDAFKNNKEIFFVLFCASSLTLFLSLGRALIKRKITTKDIPQLVLDGIKLMFPAVTMLIFASTLGLIMRIKLLVGQYIAYLLSGVVSVFLLPLIIFSVALIVGTITGSAWGTIALLVPIIIQLVISFLGVTTPTAPENIPLLFPVLGALLSGAVCGDQISPISETTIMAATSSSSYPLNHAYTQFFYAIPAILSAGLAFLLSGLFAAYSLKVAFMVSFCSGLVCCFALLTIFNKWGKTNR